MFKESSKRKRPQFIGSVPSSHLLASASCETQNLLPQQKAQRRRIPAFEGTLYNQSLNTKPVQAIFTWSAVTFYASNGTCSTVFPTVPQDGKLLMVSWKLVFNNFQSGQEFICARTSLFIDTTGVSRPRVLSRRPVPPELCKARGHSPGSVPMVVLSQLDLLPLNFVSARPPRFHGLKLSQTLLALHLTE